MNFWTSLFSVIFLMAICTAKGNHFYISQLLHFPQTPGFTYPLPLLGILIDLNLKGSTFEFSFLITSHEFVGIYFD